MLDQNLQSKKENLQSRRARLCLTGLRFSAYIGWTEQERMDLQSICISLELFLNGVPNATRSDSLEETICYGYLTEKIKDRVENKEFRLLEKVAATIEESLEEYKPLIRSYEVRVSKANVPIAMPYEAIEFVLEGKGFYD